MLFARSLRLFRQIAFLRLRITPAAELSGLSAPEGGQLFQTIGRMIVEYRRKGGPDNDPLQLEVHALAATVQRQQVLLQRLAHRNNGGTAHMLPSW